MSRPPRSGRARAAFTLLELVVTLSVISILAGMTMMSLSRGSELRALDNGIGLIRDMARVARAQAILNGQPARLIINYDETDPERFLRYVGIVARVTIEQTVGKEGEVERLVAWQAVDRGAYLPQGVYFVPQQSAPAVDFAPEWPTARASRYKANDNLTDQDNGIARLRYPMAEPEEEAAGSPKWIVYQFSPNGSLDAVFGAPPPQSNTLVVGRAETSSGRVSFNDSNALRAVWFKRSGATLPVTELNLL